MLKRLFTAAAAIAVFFLMTTTPQLALACACGCGVFDVGTGTMMPTDTGGTAWFEYDFMNQTNNMAGASRSAAANNDDKVLRSNFFQAGAEYMFSRSWGIEGELPFTDRFFKTTDDDTGNLVKFQHTALGDVHIQGIYSGFDDDMSTGVTFGFKLPTGDWHFSGFDRDTSIGTGSTDLLLGGYHMGALYSDYNLSWFTNGQWDHAFIEQDNYRPGDEFDGSVGSYYNGFTLGKGILSPLLQFIGSYRVHDTGENANPQGSGYRRLMISPGIEYDVASFKIYGDVEVPIYQNVTGNQITAPVYFKFVLGYNF